MIEVERNFESLDLAIPGDFHKEINKAIKLIAKDIDNGIEAGGQFGRKFKRNAASTIKAKGFDHPLKATGLMMDKDSMARTKATKNKQEGILRPNSERADIGFYHNEGKGVPLRPWFGISQDVERKIITMFEDRIGRAIKRL